MTIFAPSQAASEGIRIALQSAIFNTLSIDGALVSLLATAGFGSPSTPAIYDRPPQADESENESAFPYVVIGDDTIIDWDTDEKDGHESTITLHTFSRYRGKKEVKQVQDAIEDALHRAQFTVAGHLLVYCYFEFSETLEDPDGLTQHGVSRFRVVTQEL